MSHFVINCHNESNMKPDHYRHPKLDFRCLCYAQCPLVLRLYRAEGREGYIFVNLPERILQNDLEFNFFAVIVTKLFYVFY